MWGAWRCASRPPLTARGPPRLRPRPPPPRADYLRLRAAQRERESGSEPLFNGGRGAVCTAAPPPAAPTVSASRLPLCSWESAAAAAHLDLQRSSQQQPGAGGGGAPSQLQTQRDHHSQSTVLVRCSRFTEIFYLIFFFISAVSWFLKTWVHKVSLHCIQTSQSRSSVNQPV